MIPDLNWYDIIIVACSGGKDSLSCILYLGRLGVDWRKVELWHHDVDGRPQDDQGNSTAYGMFDWPCTPAYNIALARALGVPLYFSWRHGGIAREMFRQDSLTAPVSFEMPYGQTGVAGGVRGKPNTRRKYPQQSANLQVRYCSASAKIDTGDVAINNQPRLLGKRILFITGERAQESAARARYETFEPHRADRRDGKKVQRHIDHWRPVHGWTEQQVWEIIEEHKVLVHPAYRLGWGRLSCMACIFGSDAQWASIRAIDPERFDWHARNEKDFDCTIHRTKSLAERVQNAKPYKDMNPLLVLQALDTRYTSPIFVDDWELPAGAYGESAGPT